MLSSTSDIYVKAELLSKGVRITPLALEKFGRPYLQKRRAYGNSDPISMRDLTLPQELYIGDRKLICAVNVRHSSDWVLDYSEGNFIVRSGTTEAFPVSFPLHPAYYDFVDGDGFRPAKVVTLYGGGALGIFAYGDCSLVTMNKACQYCSIKSNRSKSVDFVSVTTSENVERSVKKSLELDDGTITQVMLNGGNFPDLNKSFSYYVKLATSARKAIDDLGRADLKIHLIAFPPSDLSLISELRDLKVEVAFNTEVFDSGLFQQYCPGKVATGGHKLLFDAQDRAVSDLGAGKVFSIFVGGLEPIDSLNRGLEFCAGRGVTPVINVFHADPETPLSDRPCPSTKDILEMGHNLQRVYSAHKVSEPFYAGCGRNSIDSEAFLNLFR